MQKILRKILLISLLILTAFLVSWIILYYIVWPKFDTAKLVPEKPFVYISALNLEKTISVAPIPEFMDRLASSPLWKNFMMTDIGKKVNLQKNILEQNLGRPLDRNILMRVVGKDVILALYDDSGTRNFLLISQLGMIERIGLTSSFTKRFLGAGLSLTGENYKGVKLTTLEVSDGKYSYGFVGRTGMLSMDISLLKKAIDVYKDKVHGFSENPEFRKLTAGLYGTDISVYLNPSRIREIYNSTLRLNDKPSIRINYLLTLADKIDTFASFGSQKYGNLEFDSRLENSNQIDQEQNDQFSDINKDMESPFVPGNCLFFLQRKSMKAETFFEITKAIMGVDLDAIKLLLLPDLSNGIVFAAMEPKIHELQFVPPIIVFFKIQNKIALESTMEMIRKSIRYGKQKLEFSEITHEGIPVFYSSLPLRNGVILAPCYTIFKDYLIMATDESVLKSAIDVSIGKQQTIAKNEAYTNILNYITESPGSTAKDGNIFINLKSLVPVIKQGAKMYEFQSTIIGKKSDIIAATNLQQNIAIMEVWDYMGVVFNGKTELKMVLNRN
jgi:hypothetical protein